MVQHMTDPGPVFAIGDVHGQLDMLEHALSLIDRDSAAGATVVLLGDYVDRGPESAGVLNLIANGLSEGRPWVPLLGNHDRFLVRFLDDPDYVDPNTARPLTWLDPILGGRETLASYGVDVSPMRASTDIWKDARAAVPATHKALIGRLQICHETPDLFFAHAGIRPGVALDQQTEDDLIWIRKPFHDDRRDHGKLIVHGHTPVDAPRHYGNRVNLDSGAGYGRPLTVALFEDGKVFTLNDGGRCLLDQIP
jgi:serine/threonine protein phosphatase 1